MGELRTLSQIDADIAQTREALQNVSGTETEVYSRIVGYYRSVRNWNKGKRDEYDLRKQFVWETNAGTKTTVQTIHEEVPSSKIVEAVNVEGDIFYEYLSRRTCPNCQPVKKFLENLEVTGKNIDVDTNEGLEHATKMGVLAAPTVIVYNSEKQEIGRAHNVSELSKLFSTKSECVA